MMRRTLAALTTIVLASGPAGGAPPEKPHIVFILADDMGYGDAGCYNPDSKTPMPNIDRLAADGMRFTDAHAPGALCVPSRYGLLTGRYPMRTTLRPARQPCIAEGRMTIASQPLTGGPVDRGFDTFFGIPASLDIPPYYFIRNRTPVAPPTDTIQANRTEGWSPIQGAFWRAGGVAPGFEHQQVLPILGREAERVIDQLSGEDEPFFLYLALTAPHTPWLPAPEFRGRSGAGLYGDFVAQVDDTVGRILDAIDRNGLRDDTLIFFSSDNGPVWYDVDEKRFGHQAVGPLRGMKADAWEGGHRVPLVARWPGRIPAAATSRQTLCFTDMMATFAAIVGGTLATNAGEDSFDMLPALRGEKLDAPIREATVHKQAGTAIRAGRWKLITHLGSGGFSTPRKLDAEIGGPMGQLYDLEADPGETRNRWSDKPEIVARLTDLLRRYRQQGRSAPVTNRPNFIVILADDMGYGDSSVYDGWVATPNLERMAAEGLTFTDFHSSGTVCSPTRAGLMTGRYQQRAGIPGVINADPARPEHYRGMQPEEITFAELLSDAGYHTAIFGKWHLGYFQTYNPVYQGFDRFRGFLSGNIDYIAHYDRMQTYDWWEGDHPVQEPGYVTHLLTEHAVRFIDDHRDEPFCLYVSHAAVHAPIQAPDSPAVRGPDLGADPGPGRSKRENVTLMMQALDESVGAILDAVQRNGIDSRTLVIFLSDNGGAPHMRNDPLRGGKGTVFEGGHRVPAIAWWPGHLQPAARTDALCMSFDIMPTMLDLAGVAAPAGRPLDGVSLRSLLLENVSPGARQLFWNGMAMRDGPWKLIVPTKDGENPMLFNLDEDLAEKKNIAAAHPDRVQQMVKAIDEWKADVEADVTPQPSGRRDADLEP